MQAADVTDDGPRQSGDIGRHLIAGNAHALEGFVADAERKYMNTGVEASGALAQLLRRDEHEIRLAEQLRLRLRDAFGAGRARREIVDAVVNRELRIHAANQVERSTHSTMSRDIVSQVRARSDSESGTTSD